MIKLQNIGQVFDISIHFILAGKVTYCIHLRNGNKIIIEMHKVTSLGSRLSLNIHGVVYDATFFFKPLH